MAAPQPRCLRGRRPGTVAPAQAPLPASCGGPGWMGPTPHAAPLCPPPLWGPAPTLQRVVRGPGGSVRRPSRSALVHSCPRRGPRTPLSSLGSSCSSPAPSRPLPELCLLLWPLPQARAREPCLTAGRQLLPAQRCLWGPAPRASQGPCTQAGRLISNSPPENGVSLDLSSQFAENGAPSAIAFGLVTFSFKFWIHPPPSLLGPLQVKKGAGGPWQGQKSIRGL